MAWVSVDKCGQENIFFDKPERKMNCFGGPFDISIKIPKGTIKKLIGRDLTWNDKPVELK